MNEKQTGSETALLQKLYHTAQMGLRASRMVLPKVEDEGLRQAIQEQSSSYEAMAAKSARLLAQKKETPKPEGTMEKMGLWTSIQMNTMADHSTGHVAEMMLQGTNMGVIDMTKALHQTAPQDGAARALTEEYLKSEQRHIDAMKEFL